MFQPQPTPFPFYSARGPAPDLNYTFQPPTAADCAAPIFDGPFAASASYTTARNHPRRAPTQVKMEMDLAQELEAQEAAARNYQPDLSGPLVGEKRSSHSLTEEYAKADPVYVAKTMALPQTYSHYRPIRGDGNCGWRAVIFSYYENLLRVGDQNKIDEEIARLSSLASLIVTVSGLQEFIFEDFQSQALDLLQEISNLAHPGTQDSLNAMLLERFNDEQEADGILCFFRLLASAFMKANPANYQNFIDGGKSVQDYCRDVIEPVREEIDHLGMTLLIDLLMKPAGIAVEIVYLDRSGGARANAHLFQAEDDAGNHLHPGVPLVHLLYRPGHYDILYKDLNTASMHLRQQVLADAAASSNIQVNRAASFTHRHQIAAVPEANNFADFGILAGIPGFSLGLGAPSHDGFPTSSFGPVGSYDALATPAYSIRSNSKSNISPVAAMSAVSLQSFPTALPIHSMPPAPNSPSPLTPAITHPQLQNSLQQPQQAPGQGPFRPSKFEYEAEWSESPAPAFQTSTFKNSHYNTAHYNNPNFQPEEWTPENEEAAAKRGSRG